MNTDVGKIIRFFIQWANLSNYTFLPTGTRLASVTLPEFIRDDELRSILTGIGVRRFMESEEREIPGVAGPEDLLAFLKIPEGVQTVKRILELSTATDIYDRYQELIDDLKAELSKLV